MLKGDPKTTVAAFSLTSANYNAAIELLEKHHGNATTRPLPNAVLCDIKN